jgi:hypothetical protein
MSPPRPRWPLLALPTLATAVAAGWTYADFRYTGWFTDALDYLWFADFYLQSFAGAVEPHAEETFRTTRFPPLLPLLLAAIGAGSANPGPAAALMWLTYVASTALATAWAWQQLRSNTLALVIGLVVALAPGWFLLQHTAPLSEPLMLAMLLAALLIAGSGRVTAGRALAFALLVGALPLARSIGIALVLPAMAWLVGQRALGGLRFALAGLTLLPFGAWSAFRATLPRAEHYTDSLDPARILDAFGGIGGWLIGQPMRMVEGGALMLSNAPSAAALTVGALLAVLALAATFVDWRRLDVRFVWIYCGIVFVWPFPAEAPRFMAILLPVVLVLACVSVRALAAGWLPSSGPSRPWAVAALPLAALALCLPGAWHATNWVLRPVEPALTPFMRTTGYFLADDEAAADAALEFGARMIGALGVLRDYMGPRDCVYSVIPHMVAHYGSVRAVAVPRGLDSREAALGAMGRCRYLLAISATTAQYGETAMYPAPLLGDHVRPLFLSEMQVGGVRRPAVGLFEILQDAAPAE